jgi:hypothetical protein
MPLEVLHFALMLFSLGTGPEGPEIPTFTCVGILLAGIEAVPAGGQFSDHETEVLHRDMVKDAE